MFCTKCGEPITPSANFCAACGHAVTSVPPPAAATPLYPPPTSNPSRFLDTLNRICTDPNIRKSVGNVRRSSKALRESFWLDE